METYRHSGSVPFTGLCRVVVTGVAIAGVLGAAYAYLVVYIPFIYINVIATGFFGLLIGLAVGRAGKAGRIRNTFAVRLLGFVCGVAGLYAAWGADLLARGGIEAGILAFHPAVLAAYLQVFYENGAWGLRHGGNVTGMALAAVWSIEALIVVGVATVVATHSIASLAFCERCGQWTTVEEEVQKLAIQEGQETIVERILSGELAAMQELFRAPENAGAYLRLDLAQCDTCSESDFLTINLVSHAVDKKGEVQTSTESLASNLVLTEADVQIVLDAGLEMPDEETESPVASAADSEQDGSVSLLHETESDDRPDSDALGS